MNEPTVLVIAADNTISIGPIGKISRLVSSYQEWAEAREYCMARQGLKESFEVSPGVYQLKNETIIEGNNEAYLRERLTEHILSQIKYIS